MIVLSNSFYFIIRLAAQVVTGEAVQYVAGLFSVKVMYELMLFNQSPFCEPLWYLNAVLYAVVSAILIQKAGLRKALYILTPILIAADLVLGKYSMFLFGRYFPNILTRNWLFFGLPNVAIGMAVRECDVLKKVGLHRRMLLILTVVFLIGLIIEQLMLTKLGIKAERDNYIFAVLLGLPTFLLFANITAEGSTGKQLARLGQMTSTGIYIIHPFFIMALPVVMERIGLTGVYNLLKPVFVFTASLIATVLYNNMKERISKRLLS